MSASAARRLILLVLPGAALFGVALGACIASAPEGIRRQTDDDDDAGPIIDFDGGFTIDAAPDVPVGDPHALVSADPSHGPFTGGGRVLVRGNGFSAKTRIWFGEAEADVATMLAIDPTRLQITAPPGIAGPVELAVQSGDDTSTRRTLPGGYAYDALYAQPSSGPVSGGTVIEIIGQGTSWSDGTVAKIGGKPCTTLEIDAPTSLRCTVPQGTPGGKPITVDAGDGSAPVVVLDAYTYEDSTNGYNGGLSGEPIAGELKVLVYDNFTGDPLAGAHVIVGSDMATALVKDADSSGVVYFQDPSLDGARTVTIAGKCHSPITFVDVPVDTVTAYLDPVLSPICIGDADPPPVGGKPSSGGAIEGELVWPGKNEFKKSPWITVPAPKTGQRQAAYVFLTTVDPTATFQLPSSSMAVTPESPGELGYGFSIGSGAGNRAMYALAGIEDQSSLPYKFTAYAMGKVQGVSVQPGAVTSGVYIVMDRTLDQALTMNVEPPAPGPKGPDRVRATVAVMLGNDGYAILPAGQKSPLLPLAGPLSFVGLPALDGSLLGSAYLSTARAVTGAAGSAPMSVVGQLLTTSTAQGVNVDGFVGVPTLSAPAPGAAWDGRHLATSFGAGGSAIDLSVYDIVSGNGLVRWTVVVPKGSHAIEVPDLSGFPFPAGALPSGPITIGVHGGRVDAFDYTKLRYRDIRPGGMAAYALDAFPSFL
ncbi:IPT/TIG domain-containing protein [Polyangium aurulentum]|uniref:IPT/TIG domain-containing protein n=1 Tax=Polyangium aurulentum TaxID=2567896 RepID=UPI0010AE82CF|nr:IPT/TIG domain-containing protein [Polyangium aurulentum]UQA55675.1 IPT/TIG domain-containing protein [Polyangium aurulentum]